MPHPRTFRFTLGAILVGIAAASSSAASSSASTPPPTVVDRPTGSAGDLTVERTTVTSEDGASVEVESGVFLVPESRRRPDGPLISIPFYRLRSTAERPAAPIFLLAGGPGSSWLDRLERSENFAEVERYRAIADVVLFDQRGGGRSRPAMDCDERRRLPLDQPLDVDELTAQMREMATACRDRWLAAGVDLAAYNTVENAADVLALRGALGYRTMSLIGGSYGSHLALALMRRAPEAIERVVLYGVEGLDHTWDDPAGRLAAYERIAGAVEARPELRSEIPEAGLLDAARAAIVRLDQAPVTVTVGDGESARTVVVDGESVRRIIGFQAGRRSRATVWPGLLIDLHQGDLGLVARGAAAARQIRLHHPMHYMMDCASGISPRRAARYRADPVRELLGDINLEYEALCDIWNAPDLGDTFRAPLHSAIPTLIIHGDWDVSTPIENAREVVSTLSRGHLIEVRGGTHGALYNLYEQWPPMAERVAAFLRGESVRFPSSVTLPPVELSPRSAD